MFRRTVIGLSGLLLLLSMPAHSVAQPRSGYEIFQEQSDYVVIAKARQQRKQMGFNNVPIQIATFDVMSVLKGRFAGNQIDVIVQAEASELSANCCEPGQIYLMYLMEHNGEFTLIRGRDGIFLLKKLHWPRTRRR